MNGQWIIDRYAPGLKFVSDLNLNKASPRPHAARLVRLRATDQDSYALSRISGGDQQARSDRA
jgi:hypothetical protein